MLLAKYELHYQDVTIILPLIPHWLLFVHCFKDWRIVQFQWWKFQVWRHYAWCFTWSTHVNDQVISYLVTGLLSRSRFSASLYSIEDCDLSRLDLHDEIFSSSHSVDSMGLDIT